MLPPKIDMIEYYKRLKQKGYKIYLCSNITEDTYNYIRDSFEIIQKADGGVFSCFENISKPDVEIYKNLIKKYNIDIKDTIFIDDTSKNTSIANKIGLKTILFNNIEQINDIEQINCLEKNLRNCYSIETCYPKCKEKWNVGNPTCGQCAITSLIVQECIGGTIHKIIVEGKGTHYFNIINNNIFDLTREQFDLDGTKLKYKPNELICRDKILENDDTNKRYNILKNRLENIK